MTAFDSFTEDPRWVAWRNELRGERLTKVPYGPNGLPAKANDPSTWGTRDEAEILEAQIANGKGSGIGFELGDLGNDLWLAGADLDSCIDADNVLADWAFAFLAAIPSYAERSPSGKGVKAFFYVAPDEVRPFLALLGIRSDEWGTRRTVGDNGADHGPAIEIYLEHRYFAVTENLWPGQPDRIALLDWPALERIARLVPPPRSKTIDGIKPKGDDSRSAIAFRKGIALRRQGKTFDEMCEALRADLETAEWYLEKGLTASMRELERIWEKGAARLSPLALELTDFYAFMPDHKFIYAPARDMWPAESVNARIAPVLLLDDAGNPVLDDNRKPIRQRASVWLDKNRPVEQLTWEPGKPMIIRDQLTSQAGRIKHAGASSFNLYREAPLVPGDAAKAGRWLDLMHRVFPDNAAHIVRWLAHRVQRPEEKPNHALVLGGRQGIGKDSLLEPVKRTIGAWNWSDISPRDVFERFNGFAKSVVLRMNEARDLGDINRFQLYDHLKTYTAAPPEVLRVNEKNVREYYVLNCCGVILTTNYKMDGIYLPPDDRRHYVAWSNLSKEDFSSEFWNELWAWYEKGGDRHVAAHLTALDISAFDPKAPPEKTPAFWAIVDAGRVPEDAELADAIEAIKSPKAFTLADLLGAVSSEFADWLQDRKNRRNIPHRLEKCGYVPVRNPTRADGLWRINGRRQAIYASDSLTLAEQLGEAARR